MKTLKILDLFWQKSRNPSNYLYASHCAALYYILNKFDQQGWPKSIIIDPIDVATKLNVCLRTTHCILERLNNVGLITVKKNTITLPDIEDEEEVIATETEAVVPATEVSDIEDEEEVIVAETEAVVPATEVSDIEVAKEEKITSVETPEVTAEEIVQEPFPHRSPISNKQYTISNFVQNNIFPCNNSPPAIYTNRIYTNRIYTNRIYTNRIYTNRIYTNRIYTNRIYTNRIYTNK